MASLAQIVATFAQIMTFLAFKILRGLNMPNFWVKNVASLAENVATFYDFCGGVNFGVIRQDSGVFQI